MKSLVSFSQVKYYFYKRRKVYWFTATLFLLGAIIGIVLAVSSDRFVGLLKTDDKVLFDFIKGKVSFSSQLSGVLVKFVVPMALLFLFNLSYFTNFLSFVYFVYFGCLFFLSGYAVITEFGFSGAMSFIILGFPINIIILAVLIVYQEMCYSRSVNAKKYKQWNHGFDYDFWLKNLFVVSFSIVCSILVVGFLLLALESRIFMIF